jgi:alcohol dehydrogenase class IV
VNQQIFEDASSDQLAKYLDDLGCKKIFIVTGKQSFYSSGSDKFLSLICKNYNCYYFNDFSLNPKFEDAIKGSEAFKKFESDIIIAIGGGSVIDIAKSILALSKGNLKNQIDVFTNNDFKINIVPLIAIPTTSGSGSESTQFAVLYKNNVKYSISHESLLPKLVFLNTNLVLNNNYSSTVFPGLDAVSQAIESFWSLKSTPDSRKLASEALKLLIQWLPISVKEKTFESRKKVHIGANLAGRAINISKTTAPHALSYYFSSFFNIPHGQAVFFSLPFFFDFNANLNSHDCLDQRGIGFVKTVFNELFNILGVDSGFEGKIFLEEFVKNLGVEISFKTLGLSGFEERIIEYISIERLNNNPRRITKLEDMIKLIALS